MKQLLLAAALVAAATASWSEELLTESQMRISTGMRCADTWLGVGLLLEAAGLFGAFVLLNDALFYASMYALTAGLIVQVASTTSIGICGIRLSASIRREGTEAPRPTGTTAWSLRSAGSMGAALILGVMIAQDPSSYLDTPLFMLAEVILDLTSLIAAGVTYFGVKTYGAEVGWQEHRARQYSAMASTGICTLPRPPRQPESRYGKFLFASRPSGIIL